MRPSPARSAIVAAVLAGALGCGAGPAEPAAVATTTAPPTTAAPTTTTTAPTTTTTVDPGTLPQTDERPEPSGPQWDQSVAALWRAVVDDDPAAARPFFFPLAAYRQVKAINDPDGDYAGRLLRTYDEDVHASHRRLGDAAARAQLVGLEVGRSPQWITPGVEYNKGAYWRVLDSQLVYTVDGARRTVPVKSMISWRGQWYVVHLAAIR